MTTSLKDTRNRFIVKICVLEIEGKYDVAEELIREARHLGLRKSKWLEAIDSFIANRKEFSEHQGWAIRQWLVAANYANGSTVSSRGKVQE